MNKRTITTGGVIINKLKLCKYEFTLRFTENSSLPPFIGNTLREALGQSLHDDFPHVYEQVFKVASGNSVPNPYVISAPYPSRGLYRADDKLTFSITMLVSAVYLSRQPNSLRQKDHTYLR